MGTRNYLWHFILSVALCAEAVMALEGRDVTTATPESHTDVSRSTENSRTDLAANSSNASMADPNTPTAHSLPGTTLLSPSSERTVGEGTMDTAARMPDAEQSSLGMSAGNGAVSSALPTTRPGTSAPSTGTETGTASSLPFSTAMTSHSSSSTSTSSSSSSSSSSPDGSTAVTPSPQWSSSSGTTVTPSASTSHPPTALVFSPSSTAGSTSGHISAVTQGPTTPRMVASTSGTSASSVTTEARLSSSSTETAAPQHTSAPKQGQPTEEVTATSLSGGSPLPSVTTASAVSTATVPPGEEENSTTNQGSETTEPNVKTADSLPATSMVFHSTMRTVSGEGSTDTVSTTAVWEGSSLRTSAGNGAVSPAFPTRPGTTAPSMGTQRGTASSLPFSTAMTSHSSSSPSSSPEGSSAVTPSPDQSSTTETLLATTSHPPTALLLSTAGVTGVESVAVTTEVTHSPAPSTASTKPVASTSITSPASYPTESSSSSTLGSSMETSTAQLTSTPLPQGQTTVEITATSSPTGSPLPSTTMASVGSSATTSPGEGGSLTTNQESETTAEPSAKTSHSLPTTSLATPSTTDLSPTSVNPSFTATCSPITLSIQLQNVTSTTIQFSWKPQGGTGDRPYTVRLLGNSGEMKERILNETSTAFENLLSGNQYQISVDVSTCSKNVSTSLTVQTAAEVYRGTTRITNEEFKPAYENKSSAEFKEFEKKFIMEITKHLPQRIQELKNGTKMRIVINRIENGSVVVLSDIVLDAGQNVTQPEISDAFIEALNRSTFKVDPQRTFVEARNSCQPGLNDCDQHAACTAEGASYSCQCNKGFTDKSPQVPGRVCQQDLPSQQTTAAPPNTTTTTTIGTGSTTPVLPNTNTTSTTGTGQTTTVLPNTTTTSTTGTGQTTTVLPNTTNTTGTGQTTTVLPNTTNTTGTGQTTTVLPNTNTTNTTGTGQATTVLPNTTTTTGTGTTTPAPPNTNTTTNTTGTVSTTPGPPDTKTTGFTGSTSHSVFTTTLTSAPCMPVSIEVQNVTGEEIKLNWTSGSKGSLNIISLMDGNQQINKTTTNETKAVFDNLLPGHVYTISVAVSSCAENKSSVIVRTDTASCFETTEFCLTESAGCSDLKDTVCSENQALACSVKLKNQTFYKTLYSSDSEDYKNISKRIKTDVVAAMRVALNNDDFDIVVLGFRPGCVEANFLSLLPKGEPVDVNDVQTKLSKILRSKFGEQINLTVQPLSVQSSTDNCSSWRVAVIVLGVLLGVALVLILLAIIFYIYVRRRSGKYLIEPSGLMGMFVYNHLR